MRLVLPPRLANLAARPAASTWNPTQITSATLSGLIDFENNAKITTVSGAISAISDSVAAGVSFAQATSSSRPALITSSQTGRQVASFDGIDDNLAVTPVPAAYPLTGAMELWLIGTQDTPDADGTARRIWTLGNGSNNQIDIARRQSASKSQLIAETGTGAATTIVGLSVGTPFDGRFVCRAKWDGTNVTVYGQGIAGSSMAAVQLGTNTRARLGANTNSTVGSFHLGEISAALIITGNLSDQDVNQMYVWSAIRLGI